ncbi:t-SNARE [Hortaea werneckii]|nr:t-SNARE [Hortaea werneckii]
MVADMSEQQQYNQYGGGYGQSNPYSTSSSPAPPYSAQGYGGGRNDMEMQPLNQGDGNPFSDQAAAYPGQQPQRDPNATLNSCREVGRAIDDLESRLPDLQRLQRSFTSGTSGTTNAQIDGMSADIMTGFRGLADRVRRIKGQPDASNPRNQAQVEALDRRIRRSINAFQQTESQFRREVQEQQRRQYLIVRPDATEQELQEATEAGGDQQIFQQALLNADRRGQAQSALRNVRERHDAIIKIERSMMELNQLLQDLDAIVVQQEPLVENIESKAEETNTHLEAGNVHVEKAVTSARAARKKKWICLGIVVAVIVVIVIIVLIYGATAGGWFDNNNQGGAPPA